MIETANMLNRKSQIAIEYGYRVQRDFPSTWVFWIDAENVTKMEEGYREIARTLRINGTNDKDADVFALVYDWLRNEANATWLMIIDNADDKDVFTSLPPRYKGSDHSKQIREFIPQSSNGSILVTSRSRDAAFLITCNYKNIKTVEPMSEVEALALLQTQLEDIHEDNDMKLLVETVDYIPLAITHAAAYISRRSLPIREYLQELRSKDEKHTHILEEDIPQLRRGAGRSNSIVKTWRITFEYVRRTMPSAARLLSLMCLFDRQDIPGALLQEQYSEVILSTRTTRKSWWKGRPRMRQRKKGQHLLPSPKSLPCDFEDDWLALRDFSLIKMNRDRKHFSMHPLVQFTTKMWLVQHNELDAWSQQFIRILDDSFHDPDDGLLRKCEPLIAHAYAAIPYRPSNAVKTPLRTWASLTRKVARYYDQKTGLWMAQDLYRVAAEAFEITGGPKTPEALKCRTQQALVLFQTDREAESEALYRRVLVLQQKSLGHEHLDTLATMDRIGDALAFQRRHSEAEVCHTQALQVRVRKYGLSHPSTQESLTKRGYFLLRESRYAEAYATWKSAFEARNTTRDTNWVKELDLIGLRLHLDGRSADAEHYLRESLSVKERVFREEKDSTVPEAATTLARVLLSQEKYAEAETLLRRTRSWYDASDFTDNPARLQTMSDLAHTLSHTKGLKEAEALARECISLRRETVGQQARETSEIIWILGGIMEKQGNFVEASKMYQEAYEGAAKTLGEGHADTKDYKHDYEKLERNIVQEISATSEENCDAATIHSAYSVSHEDTVAGAQELGTVLFGVNEVGKTKCDGLGIATS
jgi:tetratricopeptide (TPR) repeat protein